MNRNQHLLLVAIEECLEVGQMFSKVNRFGAREIFPDQLFTNAERTHFELDDLQAMIEMLNEECELNYMPNRERIEAKKLKVNKYYQYSKSLGLITE